MQVSNPNNIKIYNLTAGKSLPEWLSDQRKRSLQKQDIDIRRRIELLQDFEMPTVSNCIRITSDGQYILATGLYKPRIRCYDVNQLSMKFERCFDAQVVKFIALSEDYSKLVFLQDDRFIEFHAQYGKYYRTRIPKFGRDLSYHYPSCDLYFVGASDEIFRINLEQGKFLSPLKISSPGSNCCEFNSAHQLFMCGTTDCHLEFWDPRTKGRVGRLDCGAACATDDSTMDVPSISSIKYRDPVVFAAGTSTGQILLYDIRSSTPLLVKDHNYGLPIKSIAFHQNEYVLSMDPKILKIWEQQTGKAVTSVEPENTTLNDLATYPNSGMLFMANESTKMLAYYIPSLGPAPRWCAFLDNITEELEETAMPQVYDDYKFVTRTELEDLGLNHLIGTTFLRAYMHGFFMDLRLYKKVKAVTEPYAYEDYRRQKIREKIDAARANRVQIKKKLPQVNRELAEKLLASTEIAAAGEMPSRKQKKDMQAASLLGDDRFSAMFKDSNFQVDTSTDEYRLLNPVVSKLDRDREKRRRLLEQQFDELELDAEPEGRGSSSSSDDDEDRAAMTQEVKRQYRLIAQEKKERRSAGNAAAAATPASTGKPKLYELKEGIELQTASKARLQSSRSQSSRLALGHRIAVDETAQTINTGTSGNKEMTFSLKKNERIRQRYMESKKHHDERRKIRRSAQSLGKNKKLQAP